MKSEPTTTASESEIIMATMLMDAVKQQLHNIMELAGDGRMIQSLFTLCPTCNTPQQKQEGQTLYQCHKCKKSFAAPLL